MAKVIKYNAVLDKTSKLAKILENITCAHCESKFSCEPHDLYCDAVDAYDYRNEPSHTKVLATECPVCNKPVTINDDVFVNLKTWPTKAEVDARMSSQAYYDR